MASQLPGARAPIAEPDGRPTQPFYRFLQQLAQVQGLAPTPSDVTGIQQQIAALQAQIDSLPDTAQPALQALLPLVLTPDGDTQVLRLIPSQSSPSRSIPQGWVFG